MRNGFFSRQRFPRIALAAALSLAACGPFRRGPDPDDALVIFRNESFDQAGVYAVVQGGEPQRLGTVMAGQTDTLVVPSTITRRSGTVNIVARLLAKSETPQTGPVAIAPGDALEVTLTSNQRLLTVAPGRR